MIDQKSYFDDELIFLWVLVLIVNFPINVIVIMLVVHEEWVVIVSFFVCIDVGDINTD